MSLLAHTNTLRHRLYSSPVFSWVRPGNKVLRDGQTQSQSVFLPVHGAFPFFRCISILFDRFSGYWLKNSFAGKVYYLLVLLTKCWCFDCTSPERIWRTKYLSEPYCFKVMWIYMLFFFWVAVPVSHLTSALKTSISNKLQTWRRWWKKGHENSESQKVRSNKRLQHKKRRGQASSKLPSCKHSAPNCSPLMRMIGQWSTRAKQIDASHSKHAKLGFGCNETLPPWRPTSSQREGEGANDSLREPAQEITLTSMAWISGTLRVLVHTSSNKDFIFLQACRKWNCLFFLKERDLT